MKKEQRKWMSILMAAVLSCVFFMPVQAQTSNSVDLAVTRSATYHQSDDQGLTAENALEQKLEPLGVPGGALKHLPQEQLQKLSEATEIIVQSSYYLEPDSENQPLMQVDRDTYQKALKEDQVRRAAFERQLKTGEVGAVTPFSILNPSTGTTANVNGGKLNLLIILGSADNVNYVVAAIFNWETLPIFRGKDAFGITRDTDTKVKEKSASGGYSYYYQIRRPDNTYEDREEYHDLSYSNLKQDDRKYGYAYEFRLLSNIPSSDPLLPQTRHNSMLGFVAYEGYVSSTSIRGVNHWATYAHQNVKLVADPSFNFSVPFSSAFSVTFGFGWTYKQVNEEHDWRIR
ncbi:MAG: hypothetical protein SPF51_03320 [Candidatus Fimivicinus sp.]|nr:hypothetical protein [Oscillospiraceae bacterium]MDY5590556.1 hypothetical protein [Candidatus Fimivicinus sp.]